MNGEVHQISCIVAAAKCALKNNSDIRYAYAYDKYINRIEFEFLTKKKLFMTETPHAYNVPDWYKLCMEKGLQDIKLLIPILVEDCNILGFANVSQASIVCFFEDNLVTYFIPQWEFDSVQKEWNIFYTENMWENAPSGKPGFTNNKYSFIDVLTKIEELAAKIDCANFAKVFANARDVLLGNEISADQHCDLDLPKEMPKENINLFQAASISDVFGAMGSWNDEPPYMAHKKGLSDEYDNLSQELLKNIRLAILYAINEW